MIRYYQAIFAGLGSVQIDVAFPDFPGCVTVAPTLEDAQRRAAEALSLHVQSMVDDGDPIPPGGDEAGLLELIADYESEGHRVVLAQIGIELPTGRAQRINITLPEYVLEAVDQWAVSHGQTRSGLLANAAMDYMVRHR
ncbi:MAG: type II toxin-antitoxin system HicB family antitoxin [Candidatus Hydrogenedentes bacterium]|nr:type II toxin-antitoxin system HicB family antitoxin [Candidatus Hydrogenedentota bacterium]